LGTAYLNLNQTDKAEPLVRKVFGQIESAEAHLIVGSFYLALKNFPKAIEEFQAAQQLNPRLLTLHTQLGNAYLFAGNREQASTEFAAELEINARDFNANVRLGWLYREDGRLDEAAVLLKRALDLRPDDPAPLYQLAQLMQAKGATGEAVGLLEKVVNRAPDFTAAHVLLARLYYKLNRTTDAERERAIIQQLNQAKQQQEPTPESQRAQAASDAVKHPNLPLTGDELQARGDLQGARAAYEADLGATPQRMEALPGLGVVSAQEGKYTEPVQRYRAALAIDPKRDEIRFNLAI